MGHLSDDRLVEMCFAETPRAAEQQHLADCPTCAERGAHLARLLTDVSSVAAAETDALFDAERLTRQRTRILQRLQADGRPGRLLTFPAARSHGASLRTRPGMRWIAGAAAAGLVIGVLADHLAHVAPGSRTAPVPQEAVSPAAATLQATSAPMSEEELLGLLEAALEATGGSSLRPLDDLTPRVWEVSAQ